MIEGMLKTDLRIITTENGTVMHGLKNGDNGFIDFGETYFSTVEYGAIKAWKLHKKMTLNLVVPSGKVLFNFFDLRQGSPTVNQNFRVFMSQNPYFRLTVPPGLWFGFKGVSKGINLICNIANIAHDPSEVLRKEPQEIEANWHKK